jgi:hypothetical protein
MLMTERFNARHFAGHCPVCGKSTNVAWDKYLTTHESAGDWLVEILWHRACYLQVQGVLPAEFVAKMARYPEKEAVE